jgi:hypothetical protein
MAGKSKQLRDEPAVRAAYITGKSARKAALITATGAVLAALLGGLWLWMSKTLSTVEKDEKKKFVGRISDGTTGENIRGAKVSLEGYEVPLVIYTDSEGVFSFPLNDPNKEIRIRVETDRYENFDLRVTPANIEGIQEIRLTQARPVLVSPNPSRSNPAISPPPGSTSTTPDRVRGRVIDAGTGEPIAGVRVSVVGYGKEMVITGSYGDFNLASHKAGDQMFRLRAEKEGYSSIEQWHQAGNRFATIRLTRK